MKNTPGLLYIKTMTFVYYSTVFSSTVQYWNFVYGDLLYFCLQVKTVLDVRLQHCCTFVYRKKRHLTFVYDSTVLLSIGENSTGLSPTVNTVILSTHSWLERYLNRNFMSTQNELMKCKNVANSILGGKETSDVIIGPAREK